MITAQPPINPSAIISPPPVPPRTYQTVVARTPLWKHLMLILLITGAFSAVMIAMIKVFLFLYLYYLRLLIIFYLLNS
jgi:hypothetical protein